MQYILTNSSQHEFLIQVNGDSSINGNIELSIKMPSGNSNNLMSLGSIDSQTSRQVMAYNNSSRGSINNNSGQKKTNGYSAFNSSLLVTAATPLTASMITKRIGTHSTSNHQLSFDHINTTSYQGLANSQLPAARSARDLSNLIDLMPPLSIEHETKRLILAKKLDRENLDKYILAGGYQSSSMNSLSQSSSSASLTVHVKCQLKANQFNSDLKNDTVTPLNSTNFTKRISKNSNTNSILIPIHLIVTDENDNWPVFINSPYIIDLNESTPIGSLLQGNEIVAVDNDQQGPLSTIEYSIVSGSIWSDSFAFLNPLDSRSLVVKDNKPLDYESQPKLNLKIMARDQGEPPNWAITSLYINLFDNDDMSPIFSEDKYHGFVKDNRPGEVIEVLPNRLAARDGDKTINAPVMFSFHMKTNHSIHFDLDPDLGKLSLKKTLPEDQVLRGKSFCLLVRASQVDNLQKWTVSMINMRMPRSQGSDSPAHLEQLLTIGEKKLIESPNKEIFKFPNSNCTVEISESAPPGFTVIQLRASYQRQQQQSDTMLHNYISYHLLDDEQGHFNLDERSGRLTLNKSLDYELNRQISVRILATHEYHDEPSAATVGRRSEPVDVQAQGNSNYYPKLVCDITRVNIIIINHNDHKPEFSHEQYNFQLSVSDLIANFDLPRANFAVSDEQSLGEHKALAKRSGELDSDDSAEDEISWRAMQLGQIYCADRDFGDKLSLQLSGSKASLFHLTQDGRLYLPLVNTTQIEMNFRRNSDQSAWSHSRTINNQFIQSKYYSSLRRHDNQQDLPDRNYLNYLLSEFSNLGRLRLKVIATDDGQPEVHQSTALIVITIISIDNFILQRAPQLPRGLKQPLSPSQETESQLNNQTTYETSRFDTDKVARSNNANQVMMIPATNGRSFVQINPDIISSLIMQSGLLRNTSNLNKQIKVSTTNSTKRIEASTRSSSYNDNKSNATAETRLVNTTSVTTISNQNRESKFQPPSLLLVDDDGAKFVAMPAAIEVYNQQVREAADHQARRKHQNNPSEYPDVDVSENSLWHRWKSQFGFSKDSNTSGSSYWVNLSTALMLHLIVIAFIATIVSKIKSSINRNSYLSSWSTRLPGYPFSSNSRKNKRTDTHIMGHKPDTFDGAVGLASGASSDCSNYTFLAQVKPTFGNQFIHPSGSLATDSSNSSSSSSNYITNTSNTGNKLLSCGIVVGANMDGNKAGSNGEIPANDDEEKFKSTIISKPNISCTSTPIETQPNIFGHLKLTLNKMLDSSDRRKGSDIGQVTIKALNTDDVPFGSYTGTISKLQGEQSSSSHSQIEKSVEQKSGAGDNKKPSEVTKSSTFVGARRTLSPANQGTDLATTSVVSINVPSMPKKPIDLSPGGDGNNNRKSANLIQSSNSSSSSVVSLVSMSSSSSISNKINAAVERTCDHTTGSDASSLDSTALFNGMPNTIRTSPNKSETRRNNPPKTTTAPPPPPPPPPPPSLVRVGVDDQSIQFIPSLQSPTNESLSTVESKPFSSRPVEGQQTTSVRQPIPQNPAHVRLRQQAASMLDSMVSDKNSSSQSVNILSHSSPTLNTKSQLDTKLTNKLDFPKHDLEGPVPPAPPPPPTSSSTIKTVSPTTSVDRGYESYQSYVSSSQQQHQQDQQRRKQATVANDLTNNNNTSKFRADYVSQVKPKPIKIQSRGLDPRFVNSSALNPSGVITSTTFTPQWSSAVTGRKSQRVQPSDSKQLDTKEYLSKNNQKLVSKAIQITNEQTLHNNNQRRRKVQDVALQGREIGRVKRSSRTLALGATGSAVIGKTHGIYTVNGSEVNQYQHQAIKSEIEHQNRVTGVREQQQKFTQYPQANNNSQMVNYETEDDDFYYCYDQPFVTGTAAGRQTTNNSALSDYASHAYKQQFSDVAIPITQTEYPPHQDMDQTSEDLPYVQGRSYMQAKSTTFGQPDLMMYKANDVGADMIKTYSTPQLHPQNQQRHSYSQSNAGKKQLTWSDQVGFAQRVNFDR